MGLVLAKILLYLIQKIYILNFFPGIRRRRLNLAAWNWRILWKSRHDDENISFIQSRRGFNRMTHMTIANPILAELNSTMGACVLPSKERKAMTVGSTHDAQIHCILVQLCLRKSRPLYQK